MHHAMLTATRALPTRRRSPSLPVDRVIGLRGTRAPIKPRPLAGVILIATLWRQLRRRRCLSDIDGSLQDAFGIVRGFATNVVRIVYASTVPSHELT